MRSLHLTLLLITLLLITLVFVTGCEQVRGGTRSNNRSSNAGTPESSGGVDGDGGTDGNGGTGGTDGTEGDGTSPDGWCPSNTFVADLGGLPGTATLGYEVGLSWVFVAGQILSQTAEYVFGGCELPRDEYTGAIVGDVCWVDVVEVSTSEQFRAELDFYPTGFLFIPNPFGGGPLTTYDFVCQ